MAQADILRLLQQYLAPYAMTPPPRPMQHAQSGMRPPPYGMSEYGIGPGIPPAADYSPEYTGFDAAPRPPMPSGDPVINSPRIGTYDDPRINPYDSSTLYRRYNPDVNARVYSDFLTPGEPQYPGALNSMMIGKLK